MQGNKNTTKNLNKVAILLLCLGDEFIAETFKQMEREEVAAISKAILELPVVSQTEVNEVLREFHTELSNSVDSVTGGKEILKKLLSKTLDVDTARYIFDILNLERGTTPFRELATTSTRILVQILSGEHPQTVALLLGHLPSEKAAEILVKLPEGLKIEVAKRLANLEPVPEEILIDVDTALKQQILAMGGSEGRKVGGVSAVAEILNATDRATEEVILTELEEENPQMATKIRDLMFVFEDIKTIDDKGIREILKEINTQELAVALRSASEALKNKILTNMSERASATLLEDMEVMGPARLADIEAAQQNIVKTVRKLEEENRILISRGSNDVFV